jgi:hypothetical protein
MCKPSHAIVRYCAKINRVFFTGVANSCEAARAAPRRLSFLGVTNAANHMAPGSRARQGTGRMGGAPDELSACRRRHGRAA